MKPSKEVTLYCKEVLDRYAWSRWPARYECIVAARVARGKYQCAACDEVVGPKQFDVDHIECRVDPKVGWDSLDDYAARSLVSVTELQLLCKPCHKIKTAEEAKTRAATRKRKK